MTDKFEQISNKPGFMKHNGGILFRKISNTEFEFKTIIDENSTAFNKEINLESRSLKNSNDLIIEQIFNKNYYKIYYEIT